MVTDGHGIVDIQVTVEWAMSSAWVVHVTSLLLLSVATVLPSFSIVSEMAMVGQTRVAEHVYTAVSLAAAEALLTVHVGVVATENIQMKLLICILVRER